MTWMDENRMRYAISTRMSSQIKDCITALPENHWEPAGEEADAIREWAEINVVAKHASGMTCRATAIGRKSSRGRDAILQSASS